MTAPTPTSPLDAHLGYWLRCVSNQVSHAFSRKLEERGVTVAEWVMLRALHDHDAIVPSHLATELGLTRGAVSKLADRLAAKSLIVRLATAATADTPDRRFQTLALTAEGRALVPDLAALADRNDAEFFGHLAPADRAAVEAVLKGIVERLGLRTVPID